MDLLTTYIHHSELHFTDHWHTQTSVLDLLQFTPAISYKLLLTQWKFFRFPQAGPLVTAARPELLSTDNSTNWVPGWMSFHTNLLVFSSQADFQLRADKWTLSLANQMLHVTSLNWMADNSQQLGWCPSYITSGRTQQKIPSPTVLLLLSWRLPSNRLDIVSARTCLPTVTKQRMFLLAIVA
jgi:hypothetical protein